MVQCAFHILAGAYLAIIFLAETVIVDFALSLVDWAYQITPVNIENKQSYPIEEDERGTYILNSKDMCLIRPFGRTQ